MKMWGGVENKRMIEKHNLIEHETYLVSPVLLLKPQIPESQPQKLPFILPLYEKPF